MGVKETNENKGITLIALVVTIVVLLILAGISINMVIGQGGIIAKAKDAKEESRGASVEDARDLWRSDMIIAQEGDLEVSQSLDSLLEDLQAKGLLTESEAFQIKSTGAVQIGSHNINFSLDGTSTKIDWSKLEPGLYETGTTNLIRSWEELVSGGEITIGSDFSGEVGITATNVKDKGDLVISRDAGVLMDGSHGCGSMRSNITGAFIPKEVEIHDGLSQQSDLQRVVIENGATYISGRAFSSDSKLEEIIIPDSIEEIEGGAFSGTLWYKNQPNGVIYVAKVLYKYKGDMPKDTSIEIKDGTKSISSEAFRYEDNLTQITIPSSVTSIGSGAFEYCDGLTEITLPESITVVENNAFAYCEGLTKIKIPDSVTELGSTAFLDCKNLSDIEIGSGIKEIGKRAFKGTKWYNSQSSGPIYINDILCDYKDDVVSGTEFVIKDGTRLIADGIFSYSKGLTSVKIPSSVETISESAFENSGLTSVEIEEGVKKIGSRAFSNCANITKIEIPDSVTEMGSYALSNCDKLEEIKWSKGLTSIPYGTFVRCDGLTNFEIPNRITEIEEKAFQECTKLTSITIPEKTTRIGSSAFMLCNGLTSIEIPGTITEIGSNAFYGCANLTSLTLQKGIKKIENFAFENCTGLTHVTIPEGITEIGIGIFYKCSNLASVTIPKDLTEIEEGTFEECTNLKTVNYRGSQAEWEKVKIADYNDPLTSAEKVYNYTGE